MKDLLDFFILNRIRLCLFGYDVVIWNKAGDGNHPAFNQYNYGITKRVINYPYNDLHDWECWLNLPLVGLSFSHIRTVPR